MTEKELEDNMNAAKRLHEEAKKKASTVRGLAGNKWEKIAATAYNEYASLHNSIPGNIQLMLTKAKYWTGRPFKKGGSKT